MAKFQFASVDGYSRVSVGELSGIAEHGRHSGEVSSVLKSLTHPYFTDYIWIAGEDRAYYAEKLREALLGGPEQDLGDYSDVLKTNPDLMTRFPSLESVVKHLASDDKNAVVITYDASAYFPDAGFASKEWKARNRKLRDEKFEALPDDERWSLTLPGLMTKHGKLRWERPLSPYALQKVEEEVALGIGDTLAVDSIIRNEILGATDRDQMDVVLDKLGEELLIRLGDHVEPGDTVFFVGNEFDRISIFDPAAVHYFEQCRGAMLVRTVIYDGLLFKPASALPYMRWSPRNPVTKTVIMQSVLSRSAEMEEIIRRAGLEHEIGEILIVVGVANNSQLRILSRRFPEAVVEAVETTDGNLLEVHSHLTAIREMRRNAPVEVRDDFFEMCFRRYL